MTNFENVKKFMQTFGQEVRTKASFPNDKVVNLRFDLIEEELLEFEKHNMINLLRYMIYLVDFMRKNNIVWGVGRGSSVASYVLYLIGVHRINSIQFDLDWKEFIR